MVDTAEYHVGLNAVSHIKKLSTSQPRVHTTLAPAASEASTVAMKIELLTEIRDALVGRTDS